MESWTDKYKPGKVENIISQKKGIDEALTWFREWKPGKALFIHGPPGVGKSLLIETLANENKLHLIALNASDKRNAEEIESLFSGAKTHSLFHKGKIILLDEVDGISGNDRGAVTAIIKLIKNSSFPVVLIANDPWKNKLKPLRNYCKLVKFSKVHSASIEKKLNEICSLEGIKPEGETIKHIARWSQGDIRSAISDLHMVCAGKKCIDNASLEVLGYRERKSSIFDIMPAVFNSRNIKATRKAIFDSDKDPDEILWWIESNASMIFRSPEEIIKAYDILSKADIFRNRVMKQQNWRFKAFMVDMISGISLAKSHSDHGYVAYKPPKRLIELGRTRMKRAVMKGLCTRLGATLHCSTRTVKSGYLPYLKQFMNKEIINHLEITEDELELLK
ncbi:MAG: replication factor C large subunit [Nanoarchaeota archaeon]